MGERVTFRWHLHPFSFDFIGMKNWALLVAAGFITLCLFFPAQEAEAVDQFNLEGITLNQSIPLPRLLSLDNREQFFFSTSFGWMQPSTNFLPPFDPTPTRTTVPRNLPASKNSVDSIAELHPADQIYVGGQIGFLYGRSSGKYGYEYEQGYVIGELGTDKFHLTVGTVYERTNWRTPRWGR